MTTEIPTYTDRWIDENTVSKIDWSESGEFAAITSEEQLTANAPKEVADLLSVGKTFGLEITKGSQVTGWLIDDTWYNRKSDQDLDREFEEFKAQLARDRRTSLEENRSDWEAREAVLPEWIKSRLENFHAKGGENFELNGWGYELAVAELAVLYAASNLEDSKEVLSYAEAQGTSGNQHDFAKALVGVHTTQESVSETVSALTPLTGDPFFEEKS